MNLYGFPSARPMSPPSVTVQAMACPWCQGRSVLFTSDYISWQECPSCDRSQLVAWASCQPAVVPSRARQPAEEEAVVAR